MSSCCSAWHVMQRTADHSLPTNSQPVSAVLLNVTGEWSVHCCKYTHGLVVNGCGQHYYRCTVSAGVKRTRLCDFNGRFIALRQSRADRRSVHHRVPSFHAGAYGFSQWTSDHTWKKQSEAKDYVGSGGQAATSGGEAMSQLDIFYIFTCWKHNYPVKGNKTRKAFLSPMAPLLHNTVLPTRPTKQVDLHSVWAIRHFLSVLWPLRNKKSTAAEHTHTRWLWVFSPNFSAREPLLASKNHGSWHSCSRKYSVSKINLYQNRFQTATKIIYQHCWFQTFAVFWMLYAFFWAVSRRLNYICRRFGTIFPIFISG
jgi:hypothetical protein